MDHESHWPCQVKKLRIVCAMWHSFATELSSAMRTGSPRDFNGQPSGSFTPNVENSAPGKVQHRQNSVA
eukprot:11961943-Karenia_brevis.AAC.1